MSGCRRYTLGANTLGWYAICLDCTWQELRPDVYQAQAQGEQHVNNVAGSVDGSASPQVKGPLT